MKSLSAVSQTLLTLPEDERDAFVQKYASKGLSNPVSFKNIQHTCQTLKYHNEIKLIKKENKVDNSIL